MGLFEASRATDTKKYGKRLYHLQSGIHTKAQAEAHASGLRKRGRLARVSKHKPGDYRVYAALPHAYKGKHYR